MQMDGCDVNFIVLIFSLLWLFWLVNAHMLLPEL